MSTMTIEDTVRRETLNYDVGRQIVCPVMDVVLDSRTAVSVVSRGRTVMTVSRAAWDLRVTQLRAAFPGVVGITWDGIL